jgi:hypothetical protein
MYTIPIDMYITFIDFAIRKYETAELTEETRNSNGVHLEELVSFPLPLRMEAGKNTSTVIPASRKRRRKGNRISLR